MCEADRSGASEFAAGKRIALRCQQSPAALAESASLWDLPPGSDTLGPAKPFSSTETRSPFDLHLDITHAYSPFTMAAVCLVEPIRPSAGEPHAGQRDRSAHLPPLCVLKLFDRRYTNNLRDEHVQGPWSLEKENAYRSFLGSPGRETHDFGSDSFWDTYDEACEAEDQAKAQGLFEAYLAHECGVSWKNEVQAYRQMAPLQGESIPRLLATVEYDSPSSPGQVVCGVLLQYMPALTLRDYLTSTFQKGPNAYSHLARVCQDAVDLVKTMGDYGVLNRDIRLDNMLVRSEEGDDLNASTSHCTRPPPRHDGAVYPAALNACVDHPSPDHVALGTLSLSICPRNRCVAIDFGQARVRYPDETDREWALDKGQRDEEGAIGGYLMLEMGECFEALEKSTLPPGPQSESFYKAGSDRWLAAAKEIWEYKAARRWKWILTDEEQKAYEDITDWGLYVARDKWMKEGDATTAI